MAKIVQFIQVIMDENKESILLVNELKQLISAINKEGVFSNTDSKDLKLI